MPIIQVDAEAADLAEISMGMLEAALQARKTRADPDKIITDSLKLQAHKLWTMREQLRLGEPPEFDQLSPADAEQVLKLAEILLAGPGLVERTAAWKALRVWLLSQSRPPRPKA